MKTFFLFLVSNVLHFLRKEFFRFLLFSKKKKKSKRKLNSAKIHGEMFNFKEKLN